MTDFTFTDLAVRSERFFRTARELLDCASAALDEVGFTDDVDGNVFPRSRRFVAASAPAWETPMLAVFPTRAFLGQAGGEQFRFPARGDGVLALRVANFAVLVVGGGHPTGSNRGPTGALSADQIEAAAERLYRAVWAVFVGLTQAHAADQLLEGACMDFLAGPVEPTQSARAGLIGMAVNVSVQL